MARYPASACKGILDASTTPRIKVPKTYPPPRRLRRYGRPNSTSFPCPPQKCALRSPSAFCETVTLVQTAQIENSSAEMIRYYLSLIPEAFKFVWAHVNVAENTPQSSNFERTVAMHWNGRTRGISSHDMMAPAYPNHRKALRLQEAPHLLAAWAR